MTHARMCMRLCIYAQYTQTNICMYVCVCVKIHVCVYVKIHTYVCVCVFVYMMFNISKLLLVQSGIKNFISQYIACMIHIAVNMIAFNCSVYTYIYIYVHLLFYLLIILKIESRI